MTLLDAPPADLDLASPLSVDPEIARLVALEADRQHRTLEMIASENHASPAVMAAQGTVLTNKYAEGYPGARYYGGCEFHDQIEQLAIDRAAELFGVKYANVQPHSGANANLGVMLASMKPGDTFLALDLASGGHLSHGMKLNASAKFYNPVHYGLDADARIDFDEVRRLAHEHKPTVIICGYSAYPRTIDFAQFRQIADEVGALLWADMAHIAGLVAGGSHPSPFPHCHVATTTTHKTLRGPRGGLVLTDDAELIKKINRGMFPGSQGGPLMHVIAAKAVAFGEALDPAFRDYARQVVANAAALADELLKRGHHLVSGGTDNHLVLVDLRGKSDDLTGADAEEALEAAGIITNKNGIPNDPRPPKLTSGLRLGTPALTTRGLKEPEIREVAALLDAALDAVGDEAKLAEVRGQVEAIADRFPLRH